MTEQQFERLKQHLDASSKQTSVDLDKSILHAAMQRAEQNETQQPDEGKNTKKRLGNQLHNWLSGWLQTTAVQSAVVSVALTVFVFVGLALTIKPEQQTTISNSESMAFTFNSTDQLDDKTQRNDDVKALIQKVEPLQMPVTQQGRDQILAQMSLPDVQTLLEAMEFEQHDDRQSAESVISIAMQDIRIMIENQNLNGARVRYAGLKQRCAKCSLPESLEALLLTTPQNTT